MNVETGVFMSGGMSTSLWPVGRLIAKSLMPICYGEEDSPYEGVVEVAHLAAMEFAVAGLSRVITITSEHMTCQL